MVFKLSKLYIIFPYTNPTLNPTFHTTFCIFTFSKKLILYDLLNVYVRRLCPQTPHSDTSHYECVCMQVKVPGIEKHVMLHTPTHTCENQNVNASLNKTYYSR